jgi:DNA-binding NtrC family response regulator
VPSRLLIIGREDWSVESSVTRLLGREQEWRVERSSWRDLTLDALRHSTADLVVAMAVSEMERAASFFRWLRTNAVTYATFAVLPAEADLKTLQVNLNVVDDFVLWPVSEEELRYRIARIIDTRETNNPNLHEQLSAEFGMAQLVGDDPAFIDVVRRIPTIARSDAPVLITGETGTGKEICAQAIHHISSRRNFPLIPVDCTGVPQQLFENELFGHAQGAFTDARQNQKGLAAMAEGGTLFLDETDALDLGTQAKLLRFLQDGTYKPLGADCFRRSNVRVIAATNRNIEALLSEGEFRRDLYYRLNVLRLDLPPLRKRRGDIPLLARHFLAALYQPSIPVKKSFSSAALQRLMCYDWPGNVRELFNVVQRAFIFAEGPQILPCHIPVPIPVVPEESSGRFSDARAQTIAAFERHYVGEMIRKHNGNVTQAAREAGKERRSFGRMLKKYRLGRVGSDPDDGSLTSHPDDSQNKLN